MDESNPVENGFNSEKIKKKRAKTKHLSREWYDTALVSGEMRRLTVDESERFSESNRPDGALI